MSRISGDILINGKNLSDFGVLVTSRDTYNSPKRDMEVVEVMGRNGSLTIDHGRYKNINISYPMVINGCLVDRIENLRNFLYSLKGYSRIEDSFHPHEFRKGRLPNDFKLKPNIHDDAATFEVTFDCMPQRFLKSGEHKVNVANGDSIRNPTNFNSKPLIRAYGTGTLTINGESIRVNSADEYTDIDCEMQNCFKDSTNCNGNVTMLTGEFFEISKGSNTIVYTGFSSVEITPRWWMI